MESAHMPGKRASQPGIGVDAWGGAVIDPTKNVLDLVSAESKYQDAMRGMARELTNAELRVVRERIDGHAALDKAVRLAEQTRINQLAELREKHNAALLLVQTKSADAASQLMLEQVRSMQQTFNERITLLERYRYETGGSRIGRADLVGWIFGAAGFVVAIMVILGLVPHIPK